MIRRHRFIFFAASLILLAFCLSLSTRFSFSISPFVKAPVTFIPSLEGLPVASLKDAPSPVVIGGAPKSLLSTYTPEALYAIDTFDPRTPLAVSPSLELAKEQPIGTLPLIEVVATEPVSVSPSVSVVNPVSVVSLPQTTVAAPIMVTTTPEAYLPAAVSLSLEPRAVVYELTDLGISPDVAILDEPIVVAQPEIVPVSNPAPSLAELENQAVALSGLAVAGAAAAARPLRTLTLKSTGYNSEEAQTDSTPFITATGERTRFGIIAVSRDLLGANDIPYGSLVRIKDLGAYRDGHRHGEFQALLDSQNLFIVEDTMHKRKRQQIDIWFEHKHVALQWGVRKVEVEVVRLGRDGPILAESPSQVTGTNQ